MRGPASCLTRLRSPGPRPSWQVHRPAAPPSSQVRSRSLANGCVGPTVWEEQEKSAGVGATILLPATQGHFSDLLSERERAADGGVTAHDTWVCSENAGRVRNLARHEAGPCESHGKCYRSNHPRSNHVTTSGGHTLADPPIEGPGEKRTHGRCIGRPHAHRLPTPSPFPSKRGMSQFTSLANGAGASAGASAA